MGNSSASDMECMEMIIRWIQNENKNKSERRKADLWNRDYKIIKRLGQSHIREKSPP